MAEAVFTHEVTKRNLINKFNIDSCGTCSFHVGESPDSRSSRTCKKHGVPVNHRARQVILYRYIFLIIFIISNYNIIVCFITKISHFIFIFIN